MDFEVKNTDVSKARTNLVETWTYDADWNLEDPNPIRITFLHMRMGDSGSCIDNFGDIDFKKVFMKKVRRIENLTVNGKPITTARELAELPPIPRLDAMMIATGVHIFVGNELTDDEVKNLSQVTSAPEADI